jgi:hypothetical protein
MKIKRNKIKTALNHIREKQKNKKLNDIKLQVLASHTFAL